MIIIVKYNKMMLITYYLFLICIRTYLTTPTVFEEITADSTFMISLQLSNGHIAIIYCVTSPVPKTYLHYIENFETYPFTNSKKEILLRVLNVNSFVVEGPSNTILIMEDTKVFIITKEGSVTESPLGFFPKGLFALIDSDSIYTIKTGIYKNQVDINKYNSNNGVLTFITSTSIFNAYNEYCDCAAFSSSIICCTIVKKVENTQDRYYVNYHSYSLSLGNPILGNQDIEFKEPEKKINGIKVRKINDSTLLVAITKIVDNNKDMVFITVLTISGNTATKKSPKQGDNFASNTDCVKDKINNVFLATFSPDQYVILCRDNTNVNAILSSQLSYDSDGNVIKVAQNWVIDNLEDRPSFYNSFLISANLHVFLYQIQTFIRFQVIGVPRCEEYDYGKVNVNSVGNLDFKSKIIRGLEKVEQTKDFKIKITLMTDSKLSIQRGNNDIDTTTFYNVDGFSYKSKGDRGLVIHNYQVIGSIEVGFKHCKLKFTIIGCFDSCLTCIANVVGDATNNNCLTCKIDAGYYPIRDKPNQCLKDKPSGYVLDNNMWEKCFESCNECSAQGTYIKMNCINPCKNGYYPLATDNSMCYNEITKPLRHYYNSGSGVISVCNISCFVCKDQTNQCVVCDTDNQYYSIIGKTECINEAGKLPDYENYYLDSINKQYKPCYETCQICKSPGSSTSHECESCKAAYISNPVNPTNCVTPCNLANFNWYIDNNKEYKCTTEKKCSPPYPIFVPTSSQCVKSCLPTDDCKECIKTSLYLHNDECIVSCPAGTQPNDNTRTCDPNSDKCNKKELTTDDNVNAFADKANDLVKAYANTYKLTDKQVSVYDGSNYKAVIYKNAQCVIDLAIEISQISLEKCIAILRKVNDIPIDESIITIKIDLKRKNQPSQLAYQFYKTDGVPIDKSPCSDETITVKVPIDDTETNITQAKEFEELGVDVYNASDPFFNDVCFEYTSNEGKDVTLSDRMKNYYQNVSFCEEGCDYSGIDLESEEVTCECNVKTDFLTELKDNPVLGEFIALFDNANFEVLKCYQDVFTLSLFVKNIGGWIILSLLIFQTSFMIYYFYDGLLATKAFLLDHINPSPPKKTVDIIKHSIDIKPNSEDTDLIDQSPNPIVIKDSSLQKDIAYPIKLNNDSNRENDIMIYDNNHPIQLKKDESSSKIMIDMAPKCKLNNNNKQFNDDPKLKVEEDEPINYTDSELDELMYEDAVDFDKRQFCAIYWRALKFKQSIISAFFNRNPYENNEIKAMGFFFGMGMYFTFNAVFYTESYMSKAFNSGESFNFLYLINNEISRCLYASVIGVVVGMFLGCLTDQRYRMEVLIKREKTKDRFRHEALAIIKSMKIRNIIFFVINYVSMLFFWYFVSAFCNCYSNTQISWLIGGALTWGISIVFPFGLCFIMTVFRVLGIKCKIR